MLPSFFSSAENSRAWSVPRAALYGAGVGVLAALVKIFGPFRTGEPTLPLPLEIGVAILGFALLCAGAARLRNRLARRLEDMR
jgi:hypothetical protein